MVMKAQATAFHHPCAQVLTIIWHKFQKNQTNRVFFLILAEISQNGTGEFAQNAKWYYIKSFIFRSMHTVMLHLGTWN